MISAFPEKPRKCGHGRARARKLEPQGCHDELSPNEGSGDGMERKEGGKVMG